MAPSSNPSQLSAKKKQEFTLRKGNCEMTFAFGPKNPFSFTSRAPRKVISAPVQGETLKFELEASPTITWNQQIGEIRLREQLRGIDEENKPIDPAVFVARTLRLKAGEYVFQKPVFGPGTDITMRFFRPEAVKWDFPALDKERLSVVHGSGLVFSQNLKRWNDVTEVRMTLHDGQSCQRLEMPLVLNCYTMAERKLSVARMESRPNWEAGTKLPGIFTEKPTPATKKPSVPTPATSTNTSAKDSRYVHEDPSTNLPAPPNASALFARDPSPSTSTPADGAKSNLSEIPQVEQQVEEWKPKARDEALRFERRLRHLLQNTRLEEDEIELLWGLAKLHATEDVKKEKEEREREVREKEAEEETFCDSD